MSQPIVKLAQEIPSDRRKRWRGIATRASSQPTITPDKTPPPKQTKTTPPTMTKGPDKASASPPIPPLSPKPEPAPAQTNRITQLRESLAQAEKYTQTLKARQKEKEQQLDALVQENRQLKTQINELQAQRKTAAALADNLKQSIANLKRERKVPETEILKLQERVNEEEQEKQHLQQEIDKLQQKLQEEQKLQSKVQQLKQQTQELERQKASLEKALREEETSLTQLQELYTRLQKEDRQHEDRIDKLEKTIAESLQSPKPQKPARPAQIKTVAQKDIPTQDELKPPPTLTSLPNAVNGFVYNSRREPIEGAIVLVKDLGGNNLRALRTQELGQFVVSTSLDNGTYRIVAEKAPYVFDILEIELKGEPIPPLELIAHAT